MPTHSISPAGLALIQRCEGFRAEPASVRDGVWVVGFGHVRVGDAGAPVTREQGAEMLALDLAPFERCVNEAVTVAISQSQYDALVSFVFSIGVEAFEQSAVLRRVNAREFVAAACAMDAWRMSDARGEMEIIDALVRRRTGEKSLFLSGSKIKMAPTVVVRAKLDHAASILGAPLQCAAAPVVGTNTAAEPAPNSPSEAEKVTANPGGDALLLTQVATAEQISDAADASESPDAPVHIWGKVQRAAQDKGRMWARVWARGKWPLNFKLSRSLESAGLLMLFTFGAALAGVGGSMLVGGRSDVVDVFGAAALTAPGLAAMGIAAVGLWTGIAPERA